MPVIGWELDCPALDALGEGPGEYVVISDCRVLASPCLACGRATFSCQHPGLCCSEQCSGFWRDLRFLAPAETAARWLSPAEIEAWEERSATLQEAAGLHRGLADRRALLLVWRASRGATASASTPPVTASPESPRPSTSAPMTSPEYRQLVLL